MHGCRIGCAAFRYGARRFLLPDGRTVAAFDGGDWRTVAGIADRPRTVARRSMFATVAGILARVRWWRTVARFRRSLTLAGTGGRFQTALNGLARARQGKAGANPSGADGRNGGRLRRVSGDGGGRLAGTSEPLTSRTRDAANGRTVARRTSGTRSNGGRFRRVSRVRLLAVAFSGGV